MCFWVVIPLLLTLTLFTLFACCCPGNRPRSTQSIPQSEASPAGGANLPIPVEAVPARETEAEMRNVNFRLDPGIVLRIHEMRGEMFDKEKGKPLNFDDRRSFIVRIFSGHIGVDGPMLTHLMNEYVFNYSGAPLRNLVVNVENGHLSLEGTMHKVIDIPFRMSADPSVTADGWIRIHPTKIEICSLNGAALMKAFGITLQKMLKKLPPGVRVEKNDLMLEPLRFLPAPAIEGRLRAVAIEGDELVQMFDDGRGIGPLQPPVDARNYMDFRGGTLRFGKLFMVSADMQIIDTDPRDPFEFFLDQYNAQLVAGFNRNRADYGLTVYMRDADDVGKPALPGERLAP